VKTRLLPSLALGAVVLLGTTGCNMLAPQATTIIYSASDGVNVPDSGPVVVRNAMVIADEEGTAGNLIGAIVNRSEEEQTLTIEVADSGEALAVRVPARGRISLGVDEDAILLEKLGATPGETIGLTFQSGDESGTLAQIPVLDGTLPQYEEFVPEAD
jgi:hypothetical protein